MDGLTSIESNEERTRAELWQTLQELQQRMQQLEHATEGQFSAATAFNSFVKDECHLSDLSPVVPLSLLCQQLKQAVIEDEPKLLVAKNLLL